eukprot:c20988_g1_i1 orf=1-300(-)
MERARARQQILLEHLRPSTTPKSSTELVASICLAGDSAAYERGTGFGDDVVVVAAYRTPLCKFKRGGFKDTFPEDLLAPVLRAVVERTGVNPKEVGDIVV